MSLLRVLIVDDSPCLRQMLSEMLGKTGEFQVVGHGRSGEEAVKLVKEQSPDVVVLDCEMPGLAGLDTLRSIRTESDARVVMLSNGGRGMVRDVAQAKMMGAVAVLAKPNGEHLSDFFALSEPLAAAVRGSIPAIAC